MVSLVFVSIVCFFLVHFLWAIVTICLLIYSLKIDGVYLFGSFMLLFFINIQTRSFTYQIVGR